MFFSIVMQVSPCIHKMSGFVIPNFHKMCFNPPLGKLEIQSTLSLRHFNAERFFFRRGHSLDNLTTEDTSLSLYSLKGF